MINGLDLFSGIGGISIALSPWVKTVAYCENDRYAQAVLLSRMASRELDYAPIWDDVTTLTRLQLTDIDIITGGFPCQDISVAGTGAGLVGERSGLFFQVSRLIGELRPRFVFLENVPAITLRGLDRVCLELTSLGYDCRWTVVSAAEMGAPHLRERWFLLAHSNNSRGWSEQVKEFRIKNKAFFRNDGKKEYVANSNGDRDTKQITGIDAKENKIQTVNWKENSTTRESSGASWWESEPAVGRVANGIQNRVDRIRCLGNSVVPLQAREAFERLMCLK